VGTKTEAAERKVYPKISRDPKHGRFQELEKEIIEFVRLKKKTVVSITDETMKYKARELCKSHITQHHFKASTGWCVRMTRSNGFSLCRTSICHRLPAHFEEKLVVFQRHVIGLRINCQAKQEMLMKRECILIYLPITL
jgi:hypothetical protein